MARTARNTVATLAARMDAQEAFGLQIAANMATIAQAQDSILALLAPAAPAKVTAPAKKATRKPARKAAPKKVVAKAPATKGARTVGAELSRKEWNKTLATKARFAGKGAYAQVMSVWADVQAMRVQGETPDAVLAAILG